MKPGTGAINSDWDAVTGLEMAAPRQGAGGVAASPGRSVSDSRPTISAKANRQPQALKRLFVIS